MKKLLRIAALLIIPIILGCSNTLNNHNCQVNSVITYGTVNSDNIVEIKYQIEIIGITEHINNIQNCSLNIYPNYSGYLLERNLNENTFIARQDGRSSLRFIETLTFDVSEMTKEEIEEMDFVENIEIKHDGTHTFIHELSK